MYEILPDLLFVFAALLCVTPIAIFVTTVYLHRALTHDSIRVASEWFERVLASALSITTGINRREWVAVHRKHHKFTDKEGDPHSPYLLGFWRVQLFNVYYYVKEAKTPGIVAKFAPDILPRWGDRSPFRGYLSLSIGIGALVMAGVVFSLLQGDSVLYGVFLGLLVAAIHGVLYVFVLSPLINGLCHWRGKKPFPDAAAFNNQFVAWCVWGEGLHNNHHKFPRSPKFSVVRGDFDPAWPIIKLLAKVRLIAIVGEIGALEPRAHHQLHSSLR